MGVERIRLCDTLGIATPEQISSLVKRYASWGTLEIAVHTHDDFGMATANAVSALDAGAHWADGSVLGLGERAGIAQLEVIAAFFNLQRSWKHYDLIRIRKLADLVAHSVGETLGRRHPVFGRGLFECESGIHLDGLAKNAAAYEPFPAEAVGSERRIFIGMKAGFGAVVSAAKRMNVELDKTSASYLRASVRARSRALGRPLTDSEFAVLACEPR